MAAKPFHARHGRRTQTTMRREDLEELAVPFAKALAVFLKSASEGAGSAGGVSDGTGRGSKSDLETRLMAVAQRNNELMAQGKLEAHPFTEDMPAQALASRIRTLLKRRGITQKELAAKLDMAPSAISRILKDPDRSRVATLRRLANALGVPLYRVLSNDAAA